jgi:sulfofructose kinase
LAPSIDSNSFDVVGVGLNATDTLIQVPRFPPYGSKAPFTRDVLSPGGQVATAMVACAKLGLRAKYIGTLGDDDRAEIQFDSLRASGVDIEDVEIRPNCSNQSAYILVDQATGERTVLWHRDECLRIDPDRVTAAKITCARLLHIDGHDTTAVARAAEIAREHQIPVTVDVDTIYPGFERVLPNVDYLIASLEFPSRWTGESDPCRALEIIQNEYGMRVAAMTLGADGSLARFEGGFIYSPGFRVNCLDTTGAGDVFHGAFCYSVIENMPVRDALEFSNAMAALNCTALGARGHIASVDEAKSLLQTGERRVNPKYQPRA